MFKFFSKKNDTPKPEKKKSSIFSTDIELIPTGLNWDTYLRHSFQKTPADMVAHDSQGNAIALDAAKIGQNPSIAGFAMDAPSYGNPLSMKPLVNPIESIPFPQLAWYANQGFIGYQICAMIAQHWLIDKACTMPARDAMRHGYEIATEDNQDIDPKVLAYIKKRDKQFGIKNNCVELVRFNRIFGIRIAMFLIESNDPLFYEKPFNPDGIKPNSYKGISQIDPYWITPELDFEASANPASMHFYEPTWWRVNGRRIHRTHLVVLRNGQVADILKPSYIYGGVSVPQKISERVYAAERTANEAPQLALTKRTTVMKMDVAQALANQQHFQEVMQFFATTRDNFGVKTIGQDDEAEQFDTSLADFSDTIMTQYEIVAAASDVPVCKLLGSSPKGGLGANGDYEADSYHEFLESIQANHMQPLIERHHLCLMRSEILPKFSVDFEPVIVWNAVDSPSAKERAEINLIKAQTSASLIASGAIDGIDERQRLIADKDSGYNGIADRVPEMPNDDEADAIMDDSRDDKEVSYKA